LKGNFVIFLRAKFTTFFLITVLIIFFPSLSGAVENIDALVLMEDVIKCKECHKEKAAQWSKSAHSGSVSNMRALKAFRNFIEYNQRDPSLMASKELKENCLSCHAPQVRNASDRLLEEISGLIIMAVDHKNSSEGESAITELSKIKIDCYVCHMINGMPEGEVMANTIYGPGWDEDEESHKRDHGFGTVGSEYLMSSRMCTRCHHDWPAGTSSIITNLHKYSQEHLMQSSNRTCQSCHMMDGERIIHNMPVYSGTPGFIVEQTADTIGVGLSAATAVAILLHGICIVISTRKKRKNIKDVERCDSKKIISPCDSEELMLPLGINIECPYQDVDNSKGENIIESEGNTTE
jgi:hypothetical protein